MPDAQTHTLIEFIGKSGGEHFVLTTEDINYISPKLQDPAQLPFEVHDEWGAIHVINPKYVMSAKEILRG